MAKKYTTTMFLEDTTEDFQRSILVTGSKVHANASFNTFGISSSFSVGAWFKKLSAGESGYLFHFNTPGNTDVINVVCEADGDVQIEISDNSGNTKLWRWDVLTLTSNWYNLIITWNGTDVGLILNGSDQGAPDSKVVDESVTTIDASRDLIWIGANENPVTQVLQGYHNGLAIWDTALDVDDASELYVGEFGFDLSANSGTYDKASNLQHWWRVSSKDTGSTDRVGSVDFVNSVGITVSDITTVIP